MCKHANPLFYAYSAMILRALRKCLNMFGYNLLELYSRQNPNQKVELLKEKEEVEDTESTKFTKVEPTWYITLIFDFFLKEFLARYLGDEDYNFDFMCKFLIEFNKWLL